ncbi:hypothetical protein [Teichococcus aestuarii]|uniref:hypothetical protein n=1 Tax=Teichococcus aestuarii TaxID=568898 RepID=UPI003611A44F
MRLATLLVQGRPLVALVSAEGDRFHPLAEALPGLPEAAARDMTAAIAHRPRAARARRPPAPASRWTRPC